MFQFISLRKTKPDPTREPRTLSNPFNLERVKLKTNIQALLEHVALNRTCIEASSKKEKKGTK